MAQGAQAEIAQEAIVFVTFRICGGEQLFANENGICASEETQSHCFAAQGISPGAEAEHGGGHEHARRGNRAREHQAIHRLCLGEGSPVDSHEHIDGHAFRMGLEGGQLMQEADTIFVRFAHADNAAAANCNTGTANGFERAQAIFVAPRLNDAIVKLR